MRSIIIFYSYSGNTAEVAKTLAEELGKQGEVDTIRLEAQDESGSFLGQCKRAFFKKKAQIKDTVFDLNAYSLVCLGTPVWAFGMAPALRAYIERSFGLENKSIALFTTFGSGTGNDKCLNEMQAILAQKGAKDFKRFSIQQHNVKDRDFVIEKIEEALRP
ncbi:MAG TPA: NAD(P)H-dependent oxidoreductase [Candidatus Omnitrophota bacterium]|nr:NAD(P)H-dependent oxidoreductase [Candidatus Omnitrophota bacterium]